MVFLVIYVIGISFGMVFIFINLFFYLLVVLCMGVVFIWCMLVVVIVVLVLINVVGNYISYSYFDFVVGVVLVGLCVGIGLIGLFCY